MNSITAKTIPSVFQCSAERNRDRIAFNYFHASWKSMTYGEFFSLAGSMMSFLLSLGIQKGDRIAVVSENRPEWCASYMAILMCGGIAVPIDMQLGSDEIKNLLIDSETKIVFYSSRTEANVLKAVEGTDIKGIIFDSSHFVPVISPQPSAISLQPDDIASIIYTSGTTGRPKGVMLTHQNFCSDAEAVIEADLVRHDDNVLSVLPLHHTYPFMCTFLVPVFKGATITFTPGLKAVELISTIKERGITIVVAVPRLLEMIRNGIVSKIKEKRFIAGILLGILKLCGLARKRFGVNIGRLFFGSIHRKFGYMRFFASGGARLEPSVMEDLEAIGFTVLEGYGLTETSPVVTFNPAGKSKAGSAGKPLSGVEIKIGEDGEVLVKGPMVMKGYYKNRDATDEAIKNGWFFTGDTGHVDKDGYLFITGRKKEVIVLSSGKNIYPEDVERVYMSIPIIKEICITGLEKNGITDSLHAVVVPDLDYAKKALIGNISEALKWKISEVSMKLPEYMRVKGYTLCPEPLPRTPLGKLRRFMVRDIIRARPESAEIKAEDKSLMEDAVGRRVIESIKALMKEDFPIHSSDNLELDLGFDSLKRIEFMSSLEAAFSIRLPEIFISQVQTVGDAVVRLREQMGGGVTGDGTYVSWKDMLRQEPSSEDRGKIGLDFDIISRIVIYILLITLKVLFRFLFRLRVEGRGNIPLNGPFVIAPNHASFLDGFAIASSVSKETFRNLYFLGFRKYFTGRLRSWFARVCHVIPIDPETYLNKALQMSAYVLRQGNALCIFPEGGRSFDGRVMEFKKGIGVLTAELDMPVVPAYIEGTFKALPRGSWLLRPVEIRVFFGSPLRLHDITVNSTIEGIDIYQFFADELRKRVISLAE